MIAGLLKGWKTIVFNLFAAVIPIMELAEVNSIVPDKYHMYYALVVTLGNMYLRSITSTAMGTKVVMTYTAKSKK